MFSIIIPCYNSEKYIEVALKSILAIIDETDEIIVVDDGSFDNTESICLTFLPRIKYFRINHLGAGAARNKGVIESKNDYIVFLDCDDKITNKFLVESKKLILGGSNYDIYTGKMLVNKHAVGFKETGDIMGFSLTKLFFTDYTPIVSSPCGKVFKKNIINDLEFPCGAYEDGIYMFKLWLKNPRVHCSNTFSYYYFLNPDSTTNKSDPQKYIDFCSNNSNLLELQKNNHIFYKERRNGFKYNIDMLNVTIIKHYDISKIKYAFYCIRKAISIKHDVIKYKYTKLLLFFLPFRLYAFLLKLLFGRKKTIT